VSEREASTGTYAAAFSQFPINSTFVLVMVWVHKKKVFLKLYTSSGGIVSNYWGININITV